MMDSLSGCAPTGTNSEKISRHTWQFSKSEVLEVKIATVYVKVWLEHAMHRHARSQLVNQQSVDCAASSQGASEPFFDLREDAHG